MTDFPLFHVKSFGVMNNFQICQFIEEKEDDIDPEVLMTPTKVATRKIEQGSMPIRKRATTPTLTEMLSTKSRREGNLATATESISFIPPPHPLFASGMVGAKPFDSLTGATFHPDFIFCGFCTEDYGGETSTPELSAVAIDKNEHGSNSDSESISLDLSDYTKAFLRTTFKLSRLHQSQGISNSITQQERQYGHNDALVLRSLIRAIPGVRKVSIPATDNIAHARGSPSALGLKNIIVHHDASVLTGTLRHAFESAGYSASIRNTTGLAVAGTKESSITAATVAENPKTPIIGIIPTGQRLPSDVDRNQKMYWVQSSFDVQGICCASEIPAIRRIVKPLLGVAKVNINLMTKVVLVQHNYVEIQASHIAESLTDQGFPAQIRKDGARTVHTPNCSSNNDHGDEQFRIKSLADTLDRIRKSSFVESTLILDGLLPDQVQWIERAVSNAFISVQVRAVYPSAISETIKVEHNPDLVSISDIRDFLRRDSIDKRGSFRFPGTAEVYIDGADTNLYLPSENDYPNQPVIHRDGGGFFSCMKRYHINVVLSGIFWILSMVSIVDEM